MTELDKPWCPCQEDRFEAQYPNCDKSDMPYVDGVDYLERVKSHHYYERKREQNHDQHDLSLSPTSPQTPQTRRGREIIDSNFPDADFVCPCCEAEYVEETTVLALDQQ